jgi:hypothetical protein
VIKMVVVLICINLGGAAGWWLGARIGIMTGFILAVLGASLGLFVGRQYCRNNLE